MDTLDALDALQLFISAKDVFTSDRYAFHSFLPDLIKKIKIAAAAISTITSQSIE
ncbi:hypothetical protein [Methanimicrococcus hacksteinii]|uniref:hypothetical protein n=1 Tax=Methanimicrococcus hacksteinii TaxID=3028293 RepID=UPI00298F02AA|nr:hypothetical protein [Methanimicrococcus sp. At1]